MDQIFVSSVQKEFQAERYAVRDFVHGNDLLRQFFRVFLFEDLPPLDRRPDDIYLMTFIWMRLRKALPISAFLVTNMVGKMLTASPRRKKSSIAPHNTRNGV